MNRENMTRERAVMAMCTIPLVWREKGDVSRIGLAEESGIRPYLDQLTVDEVVACLDLHPHLIAQWELDIADRRGSGGWAYGGDENGYGLGEVGSGMVFIKRASFKSRSEVCAVFVLLSTASYLKTEIPAAQLALQRAAPSGA